MCAENFSHGGNELAEAVKKLYQAGQSDYSIEPIVLVDAQDAPIGRIRDDDSIIFCCRRGEREIQLTEAFTDPGLEYFPRVKFKHLPFVILTLYHEKFKDLPVAFAPSKISATLGEILSQHHRRQLHISESEKFSHVTFFLNGGHNQPFPGEVDIHIPSPKGIAYELVPELSLAQVVDHLLDAIREAYNFIVVNFANGDVIGHTQNEASKIECVQHLDTQLGRALNAARSAGYLVLVTADHGNLEQLFTPDGKPHVSHTANPVPFVMIPPASDRYSTLNLGSLSDIAPTILSIMGIPQPIEMTGSSLLCAGHGESSNHVLLIILDGWGEGKNNRSNPIYLAETPIWDELIQHYPHTHLHASGEAVGLKSGKAGNSEAGHMNIGAGRIVLQDDVRLDAAMQDGTFYTNDIFLKVFEDVRQRNSSLHLICLLSEKSSHGSIDYPLALLRMAKQQNLPAVYIHVIFDGRSTEPGSAPDLLYKFNQKISTIGIGKIVTGMGREIALDRDGDYSKTRAAYDALVFGIGKKQSIGWV